MMKKIKTFFMCMLLTLIVWSCFSWPLTPNITKGIANSSTSIEKNDVRYMIHGDHLQFLYHLWLFSDTLNKNAPLFNNVYEFNEGNDDANKQIQFYYFPFSFIFTLLLTFLNRAASYNITGLISLCLTFYLTFLLAKRFTKPKLFAIALSLLAITFPYRWGTLLGGSPTGLAMLWVPLLVLGIDKAVRDNSFFGGFMAGFALIFSYFTDTHVFYFAALSGPCWYLFFLINKENFSAKKILDWLKLIKSTLPIIFLGTLSIALSFFTQKDLSGSTMHAGRSWHEVELYSPFWKGLFSFCDLGPDNNIYLGWSLISLLAAGALFFFGFITYSHKKNKKQMLCNFIFLYGAILLITALALGTNGPFMAKLFQAARKLIPHYNMIRQPTKILCLLPTISVIACAFSLTQIFHVLKNKTAQKVLVSLFAIFLVSEYYSKINASLCLINEDQKAYEAIKIDSINENKRAHILAVTLWPGDSAFTSIYQYYASLYGIRMINGYHPVVKKEYFQNVFRFFESINTGEFTEKQRDSLLKKGINYLVVHEDLYPEKVSAFPIAFALKNLLNNKMLSLLEKDAAVWAFKIKDKTEETDDNNPNKILNDLSTFFPARNFEFEHQRQDIMADIVKDPTASNERFLRLTKNKTSSLRNFYAPEAKNSRWMIRAKGEGKLKAEVIQNEVVTEEINIEINDSKDWAWIEIPLNNHTSYHPINLRITCTQGTIDADMTLFTAGEWNGHKDSTYETILPAPLFFHAGYIDINKNTVEMKKNKVNAMEKQFSLETIKQLRGDSRASFYGPRLPLSKGNYKLNFVYKTDAKKGTIIGSIHVKCGQDIIFFTPVYAHMPMPHDLYIPYNKPISLDFIYSGEADISIKQVEFVKEKDE